MNLKRALLLLFFLVFMKPLFAQTYKVEYLYDSAGNRTSMVTLVIERRNNAVEEESAPYEQDLNKCKVTIYPNPTKGILNIGISNGEETCKYRVSVYSLSGQHLINTERVGNGVIIVDLFDYNDGTYILYLIYNDEKVAYKIIKQ